MQYHHFAGAVSGASHRVSGVAAVWHNLGRELYNLGDLPSALAACERAIELTPRYGLAWNLLGLVRKDMGDTDGAILAYHRGIEVEPTLLELSNNLVNALSEKKDYAAAEAVGRGIVIRFPEKSKAHRILSVALYCT